MPQAMLAGQSRDRLAQPQARLVTQGAHRFRIMITISKTQATLVASRRHSAALYRTDRAEVSGNEFKASFGPFGDVAVTFHQRDDAMHSGYMGAECGTSPSSDSISGVFIGTVRFRGESDFTHVGVHRLGGTVVGSTAAQGRSCNGRTMADHARSQANALRAFGRSHDGDLVRFAVGTGALTEIRGWESRVEVPLGLSSLDHDGVPFAASSIGNHHGIQIVRLAAARDKTGALSVDEDGRVIVAPKTEPFAGLAQLDGCAPDSWRGSLRVSFPGHVEQLAGPAFGVLLIPQPECV